MRIVFAGTPDFAAEALRKLIESEHEVVLVLSQPDRPSGRGRKLKASEVKQTALSAGIKVLTPLTLRRSKGLEETAEAIEAMKAADAAVLVVAAYGLIIPQEVLDIPRGVSPEHPEIKAVNIHGSLLPAWRGAAPIARAIEKGDAETGITLMQMDAGLDTGPMLMEESVPITEKDTAENLTRELSELGAEMLLRYLDDPNAYPPRAQPQGATYANKLSKEEGRIDWGQSAQEIACRIRAFNPAPGCFFSLNDEVLKAWMAAADSGKTSLAPGTVISSDAKGICVACGGGTVLRLTRLQRPGGKKLDVRDFLSGHSIKAGEIFK